MSRTARLIGFGIVTLIAIGICIRLGIWQLHRLGERRTRNADVLARGAMPALDLTSLRGMDTTESHWRHVRVRGIAHYDAEAVHAARSQAGLPGVFLLTPVTPLDSTWGDTAVLVLRGYVPSADGRTWNAAATREDPVHGDTVDVETLVTSFPPSRPGNVRLPSAPRAVRVLDRDTLTTIVNRPLAPVVLLALGDTVLRDVTRPARVPPPQRTDGPHFSYAMQWFGFATVFAFGFVAFVRSQRRRGKAA